MNVSPPKSALNVSCEECPLLCSDSFRAFSREELEFVSAFKRGELASSTGSSILLEGSNSPHLYTVLSGWGFRYKMLEDGRRQILNYIFPGDFVGLQNALHTEMQHSVEALSDMVFCVFERSRIYELYVKQPELGFDITWLAAREEQMLDEHLLSIGRRTAIERAAYLLAFLSDRAAAVGLFEKNSRIEPLTQQHVADTLGLSLVHTNKTLRKLCDNDTIAWHDSGFEIRDAEKLKEIAGWPGVSGLARPFL
ncbi:Crp/Fnr family transcriptional regulator [Oricola indica]|jgi:CRP/FNR family transcriptional regulator|uniref:Crp/Fnr family transcriptional regulator n=1 Tax=Oricola indica TaxID=2872591 RepID=UPI001CBDE225|nr:Crp/Fnr family transcriptional regulator [Oricola indica]